MNTTTTTATSTKPALEVIKCMDSGHRHASSTPAAKFMTTDNSGRPKAICGTHAAAIARSYRSRYTTVEPLTEAMAQALRFDRAYRRTVAGIESDISRAAAEVIHAAKVEGIWAEYANEAPVTTMGDLELDWHERVREVTVYIHEAGTRFDGWNAVKVTLKVSEAEPAVVEVRGAMWPKSGLAVAEAITYLSALAAEVNAR